LFRYQSAHVLSILRAPRKIQNLADLMMREALRQLARP
jgi:hypothetical protein